MCMQVTIDPMADDKLMVSRSRSTISTLLSLHHAIPYIEEKCLSLDLIKQDLSKGQT